MQNRHKTLIVDDEEMNLLMLSELLGQLEITEVTRCTSSQQALDLFRSSLADDPFALVFLDIIMPEPDGQETLKLMREAEHAAGVPEDRKAVIIMSTVLHSPDDMMTALIDGDCTDYLVKPYDLGYLRQVVSKYL